MGIESVEWTLNLKEGELYRNLWSTESVEIVLGKLREYYYNCDKQLRQETNPYSVESGSQYVQYVYKCLIKEMADAYVLLREKNAKNYEELLRARTEFLKKFKLQFQLFLDSLGRRQDLMKDFRKGLAETTKKAAEARGKLGDALKRKEEALYIRESKKEKLKILSQKQKELEALVNDESNLLENAEKELKSTKLRMAKISAEINLAKSQKSELDLIKKNADKAQIEAMVNSRQAKTVADKEKAKKLVAKTAVEASKASNENIKIEKVIEETKLKFNMAKTEVDKVEAEIKNIQDKLGKLKTEVSKISNDNSKRLKDLALAKKTVKQCNENLEAAVRAKEQAEDDVEIAADGISREDYLNSIILGLYNDIGSNVCAMIDEADEKYKCRCITFAVSFDFNYGKIPEGKFLWSFDIWEKIRPSFDNMIKKTSPIASMSDTNSINKKLASILCTASSNICKKIKEIHNQIAGDTKNELGSEYYYNMTEVILDLLSDMRKEIKSIGVDQITEFYIESKRLSKDIKKCLSDKRVQERKNRRHPSPQ